LQIRALDLPEPIREYPAIKGRKFRFDFAWLERKLLVEVNGGTYTKGAHSTGAGIARDYEKANLAQLAGWRVLTFDGKSVKSGEAVEVIRQALEPIDRDSAG
jgi:very-short-patch-repair endonuclease